MEANIPLEKLVAENLLLQARVEILQGILLREIARLYELNQIEWDIELVERNLLRLSQDLALKKIADLNWGSDWTDSLNNNIK